MELEALALIVVSSMAFFAALGGCIAYVKHRSPLKGCLVGAALGPVGLVVVARLSFGHRPMVDRGAQNSFRSLVDYQAELRAAGRRWWSRAGSHDGVSAQNLRQGGQSDWARGQTLRQIRRGVCG